MRVSLLYFQSLQMRLASSAMILIVQKEKFQRKPKSYIPSTLEIVIKYSKYFLSTVAHTIDCVYSKYQIMLLWGIIFTFQVFG